MSIKVIINGARGRMGQEAVKAVNDDAELSLVAEAGRQDDLMQLIQQTKADVVVDLTNAESVFENTKTIIEAGASPVVGASGLTTDDIQVLSQLCTEKNIPGIIVPNFSIGAVLMMQFAKEAAKYMPEVEIIEMHHDGKLDSPSGTAIHTANLINQSRKAVSNLKTVKETLPGARGATLDGTTIHAVRLPGLVAHQQVIFGGNAETLTIKHDSLHRSSFMPGLVLACKKVNTLQGLVSGLDKVLL